MSSEWKVCGRDTFAHEDYVIGSFSTEAEAEACARQHRAEIAASPGSPELKDEIWVEPPTGSKRTSGRPWWRFW